VVLPPLRERIEDVPLLVDHFLGLEEGAGRSRPTVTPEAMKRLSAHAWPGNVRELENELRRASALCDGVIRPEHLFPHLAGSPEEAIAEGEGTPDLSLDVPPGTLKEHVELLEVRLIRAALAKWKGNRTKAAEELGLSRYGLLKKINRYGIT
jgi:DNA-binding NtrC family response regulator